MPEQGASRRRKRIALSAAVPACLLAIATTSVAYACTTIMGQLTLTPSSGHAGMTISTTANGLKANAMYALHFAKAVGANCMSFTGVITLGKVTTDSTGAWNNLIATIPSNASMGMHSTCGMELRPVKGSTGTQHDIFTVT